MTPGTYLRLRREAKGYSLADVALMTETVPAVSAKSRSEWLADIEAGTAPVPIGAALRLQQLLGFDWSVFVRVCAAAEGLVALPRVCRACACSEWDAFAGAGGETCAWADLDLCTASAPSASSVVAA